MKKSIKIIGLVAAIGIMLVCTYWLGTTQAETITEVKIVTKIKEVEKPVEVIPDGYIDIDSEEFYNNYIDMRQVTDYTTTKDSLQLYLSDGSGYYWER